MTKNPATAAFEAWAAKQMRYPVENPDFSLNDSGDYKNHYVQADWETWQAARVDPLFEIKELQKEIEGLHNEIHELSQEHHERYR